MTVSITTITAVISVTIAVATIAINVIRNTKKDAESENTLLTTMMVKIDNISAAIAEIKNDMKCLKDDVRDNTTKIVKLEQEVKVLNKAVFGRREGKHEDE